MAVKRLSWNEIRTRLDAFVLEFKDETSELSEYATFWDQLLACYGVSRRRVATLQHVATRHSTGNVGFIDFFWPKVVIGEHKSLGKAGEHGAMAEEQAFDYLAGGSIPEEDFPRYVLSTDFAHMRVTDLETKDDHGSPRTGYFPPLTYATTPKNSASSVATRPSRSIPASKRLPRFPQPT